MRERAAPISERDLGVAPEYECDNPPFNRVPLRHVTTAAYDHLAAWVEGKQPPRAPYLELSGDTLVRHSDVGKGTSLPRL